MRLMPGWCAMLKGSLKDRVALVTGGSRGVGKGVAIGLAEAGATVIITARTRSGGDMEWPGSLDETVNAINTAGGNGAACCATILTITRCGQSSSGYSANMAGSMSS